ncbi:hypothetical protein CsSME_00042788 [Camellia sinensis var. sinensis]
MKAQKPKDVLEPESSDKPNKSESNEEAESTEEQLEALFDYHRVQPFDVVCLDEDSSVDSEGFELRGFEGIRSSSSSWIRLGYYGFNTGLVNSETKMLVEETQGVEVNS